VRSAPAARAPIAARERGLVLATSLAAALPVLVSMVRGLSAGWTPEGDQGIVATRAYDVFTSHVPLVGAWSTTSRLVDEPTFHPGPLLFWLLAVPARLPGDAAFLLTMGLVNAAAIVGVVVLAHRRGGQGLMFVTAALVAVMCASLQTEVPREIWGPSAPVIPFMLLIFVCWSMACGEYRLLPLAVLVASFVVQCHVVYLVPSVAMLAVGLAGFLIESRGHDRRPFRRWALAAAAVGVLCWSGPLVDQALAWGGSDRGYGNLATLVDAAQSRGRTVGAKGGAYAVVRAVGVPPWWLRAPQPAIVRTFEIFGRPGLGALISAAVVLSALAVLMLVAARRRRHDVTAACALALLVCAALALVTASFPNEGTTALQFGYASWWVAPAGMWVWLALGWSALTLWSPGLRLRLPRASRPWLAAGVGGVLAIGAVVALSQGPDSQRHWYGPIHTVVDGLDARLPDPGTVRVDGGSLELGSPVVYALRKNGASVGLDFGVQFGTSYGTAERRFDQIVDIGDGGELPSGARLVARVKVAPPTDRTFTVSLRPAR